MSTEASPNLLWDPQLSDREIHFIGSIFVHWASMGHEVFMQTSASFDAEVSDPDKLPRAMNSLQFTGVLDLWKERVVDKMKGRIGKVLLREFEKICRLKEYRDALSHGMWHWSAEDLGSLRTIRVKKRQVISTEFSAEDLSDFARMIAEVNFSIRFPGGLVDFARTQMQQAGYISRKAMAMLTGAPVDEDGFPTDHPSNTKPSSPGDA